MQIEILKRDGKKEKFEAFKIEDAIKKAFKSVNTIYDKSIYFSVLFEIKSKNLKAVEDIQDLIEKELFKSEYFDVMKSFLSQNKKKKNGATCLLNKNTVYIILSIG